MPTLFSRLTDTVAGLRKDRYWRALTPEMTLDSGVTVRLRSESDWFVFSEIFVRRDYDPVIERIFTDPKVPKVIRVLDLGANAGMFSLRCLDMAASFNKGIGLVAVEGCPPTFEVLRTNLKPFENAQVFHGLVGQPSGSALIYASRDAFVNRIVAAGEKSSRIPFLNRTAVSVSYIDLDTLCTSPFDLVKCDIEGAELDFVKNYERLLRSTRFLIVEFHSRECDVQLARSLLNRYGFNLESALRQDGNISLEFHVQGGRIQ